MTAQPITFTIGYPPNILRDGEVTWSWCSRHMERTPHLYKPDEFAKLICLDCHPERRPEEKEKTK